MKDKDKLNYDIAKESFNNIDNTFRLLAVFHNVIQSLLDLHIMLTAALEALSQIIPPLALLFMGLGQLATLWRPQEKSKKSKTSKGIKLFVGLSMIAIAAAGIAFPPAGIAMVAIGLGLGLGITCYKMWRTSYKLSQAKKAAHKAEQHNDTTELKEAQLNVDKHSHKLLTRKINIGVTLATCALVAVIIGFPPAGVACLGLLVGLNAGYSLYRARAPIARFFKKTGSHISRFLGFKGKPTANAQSSMQEQLQEIPSKKEKDDDGESDGGPAHVMRSSLNQEKGDSDGGPAHVMRASLNQEEGESDGGASHVMHDAAQQEESHRNSSKSISVKNERITSTKLSTESKMGGLKSTKSQPSTKQAEGLNTSTRDFFRHEEDSLMKLKRKHPRSFADMHPTELPNIHHLSKKHHEFDRDITNFLDHEQQALTKSAPHVASTKSDIKSDKYIKETFAEEEDSEGGSGDTDSNRDEMTSSMKG